MKKYDDRFYYDDDSFEDTNNYYYDRTDIERKRNNRKLAKAITIAALVGVVAVCPAKKKLIEKFKNPTNKDTTIEYNIDNENVQTENKPVDYDYNENIVIIDPEESEEPAIEEKPAYVSTTYVVQPGDTLYGIAMQLYGDPNKIDLILELNDISDPNLIKVGQILYVTDSQSVLYSELLEKMAGVSLEKEITALKDINEYGYANKLTLAFNGLEEKDQKELIGEYQLVYINKSTDKIALITNEYGETFYVSSKDVNMINAHTFVEVDLSDQKTTLYIDGENNFSCPNVTGKDASPTDIGYFDIDGKQTDTTLTDNATYWSHVNYWMPYNGGEGLHDADGWRSTYGGDIYHTSGSHGCVNMPEYGASYIYENVSVGTPVLVHK